MAVPSRRFRASCTERTRFPSREPRAPCGAKARGTSMCLRSVPANRALRVRRGLCGPTLRSITCRAKVSLIDDEGKTAASANPATIGSDTSKTPRISQRSSQPATDSELPDVSIATRVNIDSQLMFGRKTRWPSHLQSTRAPIAHRADAGTAAARTRGPTPVLRRKRRHTARRKGNRKQRLDTAEMAASTTPKHAVDAPAAGRASSGPRFGKRLRRRLPTVRQGAAWPAR